MAKQRRIPAYLRSDQWRTVLACLDFARIEMLSIRGSPDRLAARIAMDCIADIRPVIETAALQETGNG